MTDPPRESESETSDSSDTGRLDGDDGVDVTLVRWYLSLTPKERLERLQESAEALARFVDAAR